MISGNLVKIRSDVKNKDFNLFSYPHVFGNKLYDKVFAGRFCENEIGVVINSTKETGMVKIVTSTGIVGWSSVILLESVNFDY